MCVCFAGLNSHIRSTLSRLLYCWVRRNVENALVNALALAGAHHGIGEVPNKRPVQGAGAEQNLRVFVFVCVGVCVCVCVCLICGAQLTYTINAVTSLELL